MLSLIFRKGGPAGPTAPKAPRVTCPNCHHEFDHPSAAAPAHAEAQTHAQLYQSRKDATLAFARQHHIIKSAVS